MKLNELLEVTCMDTIIKIEGIKERKIIIEKVIDCKDKYGRIDSEEWEEVVKKYGKNKVIHQYVENNTLVILIKY